MIMKVKKIKNIDKSMCFGEQVIAYNYAQRYSTQLQKVYNANIPNFVRADAIQSIIKLVVSDIKSNEKLNKFNIDAIIHCFRNGIEEFAKDKYNIYTDYKKVGNVFKCYFEII